MLGHHYTAHPAITIFGLFEEATKPHLGTTGGNFFSQVGYDDKTLTHRLKKK